MDDLLAEEFKDRQPSCVVFMDSGRMSLPGEEILYWDLDETWNDDAPAPLGEEIRRRVDTLVSDLQGRYQCG
jgi:hypothetical protein